MKVCASFEVCVCVGYNAARDEKDDLRTTSQESKTIGKRGRRKEKSRCSPAGCVRESGGWPHTQLAPSEVAK